jgi:hypothetical protein
LAAAHLRPGHGSAVLDPLIHFPTRLKIVATLAALPDGDALSFTRLQDVIELTPGNPMEIRQSPLPRRHIHGWVGDS